MPLSAPLSRRSASPRSRRSRRPTARRRRSGRPCRPLATPPRRSLQASSASASRRPRSTSSTGFGGHRIDSNGRLFRFGLTEAEHEEDDGGDRPASVGHLGWWQVMKYWRALFGDDPADKLEVRGYRDASTLTRGDAGRSAAADQRRPSSCRPPRRGRSGGARNPARGGAARGHHRYLVVGGLHQLRDPAVGRRGERVQVRQRPSRLYLRRFRGERGRTDQRRPATGSIVRVRSPRPGLARAI